MVVNPLPLPNSAFDDARAVAWRAPLPTLQHWRAAHALLESSFGVQFSLETRPAWEHLAKTFSLRPSFGDVALPTLDVQISHEVPLCRVGNVSRVLLFPHAITNWCRAHWEESRALEFNFRGLLTPARRVVLEQWGRESFGAARFQARVTPRGKAGLVLNKLSGGGLSRATGAGANVKIADSGGGRVWPNKVWDASYYREMCSTKFALCPDGDFVWTYRFFEAALCGAIPVVQNLSAHYDGFRFYEMKQPAHELTYRRDWAEANYARAVAVLTASRDELDAAITSAV